MPDDNVYFVLEGRKPALTLIAAFRCDRSAVICADSQETATTLDGFEYRVHVTKINPQDANLYNLVVGGAGASGPLIDRFSRDLQQAVSAWPAGSDNSEMEQRLQALLEEFHLTKVLASSYQSGDFSFIVSIQEKGNREFGLWVMRDTAVAPIEKYTMIGWDEDIYRREMDWLYQGTPSIAQGVLLAVRLFTMAKETSNYVGGQTQVIVVRDNGMHVQDHKAIEGLEKRVTTFNQALADVVRLCPDLSIPDSEFQASLLAFEDTGKKLRQHYFQSAVMESLQQAASNPDYKGDSYSQFPVGVLAKMGTKVTKYKETDEGQFAPTVSVSASPTMSTSPSASLSLSSSLSPSTSPSASPTASPSASVSPSSSTSSSSSASPSASSSEEEDEEGS